MVGPRIAGPVNGVRFSAPAPFTPGRPLRSRRQSEKLEKHVRLVPLAPGGDRGRVAQACDCGSHYGSSILSGHPIFYWEVAKPVRRLILNQIMRRFESSPPSHGRVADWKGAALSMQIMRVQFSPRSPDFLRSRQAGKAPGFEPGYRWSNPASASIVSTSGVKLDWRTEGGLSSRYRPVRFRLALPTYVVSGIR